MKTGEEGVMVNNALELVAVPATLVTMTVYVPTLAADTLLMIKLVLVEPEILPPSARFVPLSRH